MTEQENSNSILFIVRNRPVLHSIGDLTSDNKDLEITVSEDSTGNKVNLNINTKIDGSRISFSTYR